MALNNFIFCLVLITINAIVINSELTVKNQTSPQLLRRYFAPKKINISYDSQVKSNENEISQFETVENSSEEMKQIKDGSEQIINGTEKLEDQLNPVQLSESDKLNNRTKKSLFCIELRSVGQKPIQICPTSSQSSQSIPVSFYSSPPHYSNLNSYNQNSISSSYPNGVTSGQSSKSYIILTPNSGAQQGSSQPSVYHQKPNSYAGSPSSSGTHEAIQAYSESSSSNTEYANQKPNSHATLPSSSTSHASAQVYSESAASSQKPSSSYGVPPSSYGAQKPSGNSVSSSSSYGASQSSSATSSSNSGSYGQKLDIYAVLPSNSAYQGSSSSHSASYIHKPNSYYGDVNQGNILLYRAEGDSATEKNDLTDVVIPIDIPDNQNSEMRSAEYGNSNENSYYPSSKPIYDIHLHKNLDSYYGVPLITKTLSKTKPISLAQLILKLKSGKLLKLHKPHDYGYPSNIAYGQPSKIYQKPSYGYGGSNYGNVPSSAQHGVLITCQPSLVNVPGSLPKYKSVPSSSYGYSQSQLNPIKVSSRPSATSVNAVQSYNNDLTHALASESSGSDSSANQQEYIVPISVHESNSANYGAGPSNLLKYGKVIEPAPGVVENYKLTPQISYQSNGQLPATYPQHYSHTSRPAYQPISHKLVQPITYYTRPIHHVRPSYHYRPQIHQPVYYTESSSSDQSQPIYALKNQQESYSSAVSPQQYTSGTDISQQSSYEGYRETDKNLINDNTVATMADAKQKLKEEKTFSKFAQPKTVEMNEENKNNIMKMTNSRQSDQTTETDQNDIPELTEEQINNGINGTVMTTKEQNNNN